MLQKTASLQLERSWGLGQSVLTSARSFPIGSAGYHSMRTKRRLSTRLTSCVTSLKGTSALFAPLFIEVELPLWTRGWPKCCLFLYSNNPIVLGPDNSNLPKIFLIIADGVANESVKSEDACSKRLANVIRQVQVSHHCHCAMKLHLDSDSS